jgi:UDP-N-acetylglucosamine 1-carboxyvinyltransferase
MEKLHIWGGKALHGSVEVAGAKNAALPIFFSSLLTDQVCTYRRVPVLQDVRTTLKLLKQLGVEVNADLCRHTVQLKAEKISTQEAPYDLVRTMRASVVVLGPLLARFGKAKVSLPGGCAIGTRPINYHLMGFEKLGAEIKIEQGYVIATCPRLRGNRVVFDFPSVGATENLMMAATLAEGETILENCAQEPEISDLAQTLREMGAILEGEGTETIHIQGQSSLHGCNHEIIGDRIEAGTYLAAALATRGSVRVEGINPEFLEEVLLQFEAAGATIVREKNTISLHSNGQPQSRDVTTRPYPGFPTDMQAQFIAAMAVSQGVSMINETIFENRFMHVPELLRLGADITIRGKTALVRGKQQLIGAPLMATDLRASAALIIGGLCSKGKTSINRIYHLDRGYEQMEEKLKTMGAVIERIKQ